MTLTYGSVCSGIEAASVAWEPIGMLPAWFSEIEPFPSAVLAAHWPQVNNLGDMTKIAAAVRSGTVTTPDLLVGGTPCQAFSVAGLRGGLSDERGQLTLSYVELADSIDEIREQNGEQPTIIVWENVPGVLSSKDNAFGCFLAGLAGESEELKPTGGKWSNAGYVSGPKRTVAWRILDAQYLGVPQRRRRVFVIASARKDICPAEILFESDSLHGDSPACGEAEQTVAALTKNGVGATGADDNQAQAGHLIAGSFRMATFGEYVDDETASTVKARDYKDATDLAVMSVHGTQDPDVNYELAHTLGRNHGQENACFSFAENSQGEVRLQNGDGQITGPLSTGGGKPGQGYPAIAVAGNIIGRSPENGGNGNGFDESGVSYTLTKTDVHAVSTKNIVRRLTPVECERLQGFPDNHTQISWRGKDAADCPDGPRYRAIGNSMAVPVMRWIGERILAALPVQETPDLRSDYVIELDDLRNKPAHMLKDVGDQWRTPDALYWGINAKFGPFTLDLFTDGQNSKCPDYYTAEDNALTQDWSEKLKDLGGSAYGNPPYSRSSYHDKQAVTGVRNIMEHAKAMREKGGRYVFLLKAATSEVWWPEWADHIAFIRGRVGFDLPEWFVPADKKQKPSGAFFAGAIVVLDKAWTGDKISYISRDELIATGDLFMQQAHWLVERNSYAA
ncbi:phage N-6-adenine-methyltransferase [Morganella psychrotolerans]|uniref:Cytosine-specific methyltransferase n=1 Tax=Morganella psychrotolerans TaxID=368603 RepID=A0A1B8H6X1_9GAMM|nr:phage N-6-adenine-methyltransferase [Morganella psychrotolerans]OBU04810.1 phage N-6-adenine-methyltransferase [Morganella psychrotolerans]